MANIVKVKVVGFVIEYHPDGLFTLESVFESDPLPEESDRIIFVPVKVPVWDVYRQSDDDEMEYIGSDIETAEVF